MKKDRKAIGKKLGTFFVVNFITTLIDYGFYTLTARIIGNNDFLWVATMVGGVFGTIIGYALNNRITWKEVDSGKYGMVKFFAWNATKIIAIKPVLTVLYGKLTGLYEFAFSVSNALHLPFDYDFVESTGIFVLTVATTMVFTYLFCDRLIFCDKEKKGGKKKNMKSISETGKETEGSTES